MKPGDVVRSIEEPEVTGVVKETYGDLLAFVHWVEDSTLPRFINQCRLQVVGEQHEQE